MFRILQNFLKLFLDVFFVVVVIFLLSTCMVLYPRVSV